jgi:asparagine synthase (glutamine-hydrolysing)
MPGIVGIFTRISAAEASLRLQRMAETVLHESFYTIETWSDELLGVYVAGVERGRLFEGRSLTRREGSDVLTMSSGEEFSDPTRHGCLDDPSFPAGLNGRFHGLVVDQNRCTALLFNDRYGMHRLYYYESKDAFYFASEAKAILAVCPESRAIDPRGMGEFVSCGGVLENRTLFQGIHVLPPASAWVFRNGTLAHKGSYFHPKEWEEQEPLDLEAYYRELREVFTRNLPRYFAGDQQIAMSLTGGLDTRMILASRKPERGSLPCYTFGSMYRENHDVRVARRVAEVCGQSHQVITAGKDFLRQFSRYAERAVYLTDGCVDVSRAPDLYVNEKARGIAPVRMTGTYGGEILRGVRAFKAVDPLPGVFTPEFHSHIRLAAQTYTEISRCHPVTFGAFRQAPWYLYGVLALEQTQLCVRSPFLDNGFVRTVLRAPAASLMNNEVSLRLIADGNPALLQIATDRGVAGNRTFARAAISRAALELQFKAEYAYDLGMPQWLARLDHTFSPLHLERNFLGRHKPFHFRIWYRDALAGYVREMLLDPKSLCRPYVERNRIETLVQAHLNGTGNYTTELHQLLTLELIHRVLLEQSQFGNEHRLQAGLELLDKRPAHRCSAYVS